MDDGLIQVTEDNCETWRKIESFPGVPELTYVADIKASAHDADTVYAVFNNHKRGDFKPYVLKSTDRGRSWSAITGDLPDRHVTWSIQEDHEQANLLFVGTEFGLFFTIDGGAHWIQLTGGVPVIPFRDLEIQKRENDLVCATFGRGFYILDDYSSLRLVSEQALEQEAVLFPVKDAWIYIQDGPLGYGEKATMGDAFFTAPNPPFGAVFTYYLKDSLKSPREERKADEAALQKEGKPVFYPSWDSLREEDFFDTIAAFIEVSDSSGKVIRRVPGPTGAGFNRIAWDLRYPLPYPVRIDEGEDGFRESRGGPLAIPGEYSARLVLYADGSYTPVGEPQKFNTRSMGMATLEAQDKAALLDFQLKVAELLRKIYAMDSFLSAAEERIAHMKQAIFQNAASDKEMMKKAREIELRLKEASVILRGDLTVSSRFEPTKPSALDRINRATDCFGSMANPTTTHQQEYDIAMALYDELYQKLHQAVEVEMVELEKEMEAVGSAWTPGRELPELKQH
jgi:hypothetical protein